MRLPHCTKGAHFRGVYLHPSRVSYVTRALLGKIYRSLKKVGGSFPGFHVVPSPAGPDWLHSDELAQKKDSSVNSYGTKEAKLQLS